MNRRAFLTGTTSLVPAAAMPAASFTSVREKCDELNYWIRSTTYPQGSGLVLIEGGINDSSFSITSWDLGGTRSLACNQYHFIKSPDKGADQ
jgi:hypothetical protein